MTTETEDERKARLKAEADAKAAQQNGITNFLNSLNPFTDSNGDFSFGGIFKILIVGVISYFAIQNESIQGWIGQFLDEKDANGNKIENSGKDKIKGWADDFKNMLYEWMPDFFKKQVDVTEMMKNPNGEDTKVKSFIDTLPPALQPIVTNNLQTLTGLVFEANKNADGKMDAEHWVGEIEKVRTGNKNGHGDVPVEAVVIEKAVEVQG